MTVFKVKKVNLAETEFLAGLEQRVPVDNLVETVIKETVDFKADKVKLAKREMLDLRDETAEMAQQDKRVHQAHKATLVFRDLKATEEVLEGRVLRVSTGVTASKVKRVLRVKQGHRAERVKLGTLVATACKVKKVKLGDLVKPA